MSGSFSLHTARDMRVIILFLRRSKLEKGKMLLRMAARVAVYYTSRGTMILSQKKIRPITEFALFKFTLFEGELYT